MVQNSVDTWHELTLIGRSLGIYAAVAVAWLLSAVSLAREQAHQGTIRPLWRCWELWVTLLAAALFTGCRFYVGDDYPQYYQYYLHLLDGQEWTRSYGPGFEYISRAMAWMHFKPSWFFAFWGTVPIAILYMGLNRHRNLLPWIMPIFVFSSMAIDWLNLIRNFIPIMALVPMLPWIEQRRLLPYFAVTVLLCTLHLSAVMLIPIYFLPRLIPTKIPTRWLIAMFVICFAISLCPIVLKSLTWPLIGHSWLGSYNYLFAYMIVEMPDFVRPSATNTIAILPILILLLNYNSVSQHHQRSQRLHTLFAIALPMMLVAVAVRNMTEGHVYLRPFIYGQAPLMILMGYTLIFLWRRKRHTIFTMLLLLQMSPILSKHALQILFAYRNNSAVADHFIYRTCWDTLPDNWNEYQWPSGEIVRM